MQFSESKQQMESLSDRCSANGHHEMGRESASEASISAEGRRSHPISPRFVTSPRTQSAAVILLRSISISVAIPRSVSIICAETGNMDSIFLALCFLAHPIGCFLWIRRVRLHRAVHRPYPATSSSFVVHPDTPNTTQADSLCNLVGTVPADSHRVLRGGNLGAFGEIGISRGDGAVHHDPMASGPVHRRSGEPLRVHPVDLHSDGDHDANARVPGGRGRGLCQRGALRLHPAADPFAAVLLFGPHPMGDGRSRSRRGAQPPFKWRRRAQRQRI